MFALEVGVFLGVFRIDSLAFPAGCLIGLAFTAKTCSHMSIV